MIEHIFVILTLIGQGLAAGGANLCCGAAKTGDVRGTILRVYFNLQSYTDASPKCLPMRRWVHGVSSYSMTCYKRADTMHIITVYHGEKVVDSALVEGCDKTDIAGSVTVVPQQDGSDVLQYEFSPNSELMANAEGVDFCKRVRYYMDGIKRRDIGTCQVTQQPEGFNRNCYRNGWKEEELKLYGYVNEFIDQDGSQCQYKGGWKGAVKDVILQCYDCGQDFVGQINYRGTTLASTRVGTCEPPLQESFNVVTTKNTPDVVGVQFWFLEGSCVKKNFNLKDKVQVNGQDACSEGARKSSLWRRLMQGM